MVEAVFSPEQKPQVPTAELSTLDHMRIYASARLGEFASHFSGMVPHIDGLGERTRDAAPVVAATVVAGIGAASLAPNAVPGAPADADARARGHKPSVVTTRATSKMFQRMLRSCERKSDSDHTISYDATSNAYNDENSKSKVGRIRMIKHSNGDYEFAWNHRRSAKLVCVQENFSDGTIKFTRHFREKKMKHHRRGGSVEDMSFERAMKSGQDPQDIRFHDSVVVYLD